MSGNLYGPFPTGRDASEDFIRLLTCDSLREDLLIKCMQSKSWQELTRAYESIMRSDSRKNNYFGPIFDGLHFKSPYQMIVEDNYTIDIPVLIGVTSHEGAFVDGE